ncbi:stage III sporulation protein AA [Ruminococcaceae bacterium FB2012]|nr:stage III sporulation protein AA [Ruminococcaceae bacterium FB2012]
MQNSRFEQALGLLSSRLSRAASLIKIKGSVHEIHLRRGGFLSVSFGGRELFVSSDGVLKESADTAVQIFDEDIEYTYRTSLKNSLHSFENEIKQGYITSEGGNRVGFCGRAVCPDVFSGTVSTVKEITSVNIRIASEIIGCSDDIYGSAFADGICSLIIAGPPSSGKTTVLRDLCRRLSGKYRVSLIDERGELAAVSEGRAVNDIGPRTDVFTGYPKLTAIMTAVRVMDPQVLICDEVGAGDELSAYRYAVNSGVKVIATCHASSLEELLKRPVISELIKDNAFDKAVFLGSGKLVGRMLSCHRFGVKLCSGFSAV